MLQDIELQSFYHIFGITQGRTDTSTHSRSFPGYPKKRVHREFVGRSMDSFVHEHLEI